MIFSKKKIWILGAAIFLIFAAAILFFSRDKKVAISAQRSVSKNLEKF